MMSADGPGRIERRPGWAFFCAAMLLVGLTGCRQPGAPKELIELAPGLAYTNHRTARMPWSTHIVRVDRSRADFDLHSTHAFGTAMGLSTLVEQIESISPELGTPVVGVNGDFYAYTGKPYAGDPRGLQIVQGELLSAPSGGVSFWVDAAGQFHATNVHSLFQVVWPDGTVARLGLNEERRTNWAVLYTSALGTNSTLTAGGAELVLEPAGDGPWLPLHVGDTIWARVREVRLAGNTPLAPDLMVLSIDPALMDALPWLEKGVVVKLSFDTWPDLRGIRTAISGGPMLVREGRREKLVKPPAYDPGGAIPYEFASMRERHPRTALGWNDRFFYFVVVDGRQKKLSIGMTLTELATYLISLGCTHAMNLDGGGSATLWFDGKVVNSPCDRKLRAGAKPPARKTDEDDDSLYYEPKVREIANALVLVRRPGTEQVRGTYLTPPAGQ